MQPSSTSGSLSIVNNSPFSFWGRPYIGSYNYWNTYSFEHTNKRKQELIYFFFPYLNWTRNFFFPVILWKYHHLFTHPSDSSLICVLLHLPNLLLHKGPHIDLRLDLLLILHILCNIDNIQYHGGLGGAIRDCSKN